MPIAASTAHRTQQLPLPPQAAAGHRRTEYGIIHDTGRVEIVNVATAALLADTHSVVVREVTTWKWA